MMINTVIYRDIPAMIATVQGVHSREAYTYASHSSQAKQFKGPEKETERKSWRFRAQCSAEAPCVFMLS